MTDQTIDNLDDTLDDLADLPQSSPFPPGAHHAKLFLIKNLKKAGAYTAKFKYVATLEFANPADAEENPETGYKPPKENDEAIIFINTKKKTGEVNEYGQGQLKMFAKPIGDEIGSNSAAEVALSTKNGRDCIIVTAIKAASGEYAASMIVNKFSLMD